MNLHTSLKVKFDNNFNQVNNSEFVAGTALIAYQGNNRNMSDITEEAFNDAMPSLGLIPIVGHWLSEKQNFGGHDITIEWVGNDLILKDNTVPYGVVKESHNAKWVEIEDNGVKHKYLKADVILWKGRYPEQIQKVIDTGVNQSMEINVSDYSEKNNCFQINKFEYSALCLLGRDRDENGVKGENDVEPCFEQASVVIDKFNLNDKFKEQFNSLLFEFDNQINGGDKNLMAEEGGGNIVSDINKNIVFSITYKQKRCALENALDSIVVRNNEDIIIEETFFYVEDFSDEYVMVQKYYYSDNNSECTCGRFTYSFDDTSMTATIDMDSWEKMMMIWVTEEEHMKIEEDRKSMEKMSADFESLKIEVENYKNNISVLESEKQELFTKVSKFESTITEKDTLICELQEYKNTNELEFKKSQIEEILLDFETVLGDNDEFKTIKDNALKYEIDALEKELYALEGKVKHSKTAKSTKKTQSFSSKVSIIDPPNEPINSYYGDAIKYIKK